MGQDPAEQYILRAHELEEEAEKLLVSTKKGRARFDCALRAGGKQKTRIVYVEALRSCADFLGHREAQALLRQAHDLYWKAALQWKGLVVQLARKKLGYRIRGDQDTEDLIQEGLQGLYKAACRFEPERGFAFSTYNRAWATVSMQRALMPGEVVGMPTNLREAAMRYSIWGETAVSDPERCREALETINPSSLDRQIGPAVGESSARPIDFLEGNLPDPSEKAIEQNLGVVILNSIAELSEREQRVIRGFFGIGVERKTTRELAAVEGLSQQAISQIKKRALLHLKQLLQDESL